ncbi:uncharacterized protein [Coffea arabica]|uniref:BED-type domain-containing protein n=1 Tax=Coffea arabica TaxID=13443 RepID=A0A6P6WLT0_COFAR|nr:uncharacterized protein LOC113734053 [Coffea arabica]
MEVNNSSERRTKQKRDPAWNYCEMYKNGEKVELKCVFCGKIFKGGGIHRVKEHLAGAKGDGGSPCMRVDPDVRRAMQENLSGVVGKRKKKQRFVDAEDELLIQNDITIEDEGFRNNYDLNTVDDLLRLTETIETNSDKRLNIEGASNEFNGEQSVGGMTRRRRRNLQENSANMEPVAIGSLKRDPAWKHCQMFNNGGKVLLKCVYCGKIFNGGGIYRLKEHLAGRTGNGSVCSEVQSDVRLLMQESLNVSGSVGKKKKKQKHFIEMPNHNAGNGAVQTLANGRDLNNEIDLLPETDALEENSDVFLNQEHEGNGSGGRIEKGQMGKASVLINPHKSHTLTADGNKAVGSKVVDNQVQMAIGHFLLYAGISFDATNSVYFRRMIEAIASQGSQVVTPSCNDLRSWILKNSVKEVKSDFGRFTGCWARSGCSILVDDWVTQNGRTLVKVLVDCPEGNLFLKSLDISEIRNPVDALYELLAKVIEEVGVRNVLQVVTRGEEPYFVCGKRLIDAYPSIFWTPCAGHCLSLMLKDFTKLDLISAILEQAKSITRFIYNHNVILNMMRRHTFGVDLVDIGVSKSATDFMTLNRLVSLKQNLQNMVSSEEWAESPYSREPEGLAVLDCFSSESFWSTCALISRLADPFLRLLRIVSSEKRPGMGYVYAGIYRAKETIKKELVNQKDYHDYWNIIHRRWEKLQHHPLFAAGFYLNPKFFYSTGGDMHHIRSHVYDCVEKLVPDPNTQDKIVKETISYQNGDGDFGRKMAIRARDTLLPAEWWSTYGGACPNLARFAIRILGQTCSLIGSKPSHIPLEQMHETKNCLEYQRLNDLVLVQYNWWLKERAQKIKEQEPVDPLLHANSRVAEDWLMKEEAYSDDQNISDWSTISPPMGNIMLLGSRADDFEALGVGFDDLEVLNGVSEEATDDKPAEFF